MFFDYNEENIDKMESVFLCAFILFILDIIINFNTAYFQKD